MKELARDLMVNVLDTENSAPPSYIDDRLRLSFFWGFLWGIALAGAGLYFIFWAQV
jgi:hypothetical protein